MEPGPQTPDARIERILGEIERSDDDAARARARALVDAVLEWHRAALTRLVDIAASGEKRELLAELGKDPQVASLLELHGIDVAGPPVDDGLLSPDKLVRRRAPSDETAHDACEMCGAAVAAEHDHLFDPTSRALRCVCPVCVRVTSGAGGWVRVEPRVEILDRLEWSDADWERLGIPIRLAFFQPAKVGPASRAFYPSPAGAIEAALPGGWWQDLAAENPRVSSIHPDVQALLVHRLGDERRHVIVSIDRAYELVGLLRRDWKGIGGGTAMWTGVNAFFDRLEVEGRARG